MDGWAELEKRVAFYTAKFNVGPVPRPEFWSGFRLRAERFEFWKEGSFRLHKRFVFTPSDERVKEWDVQQVFP
jgi:pyridoxamine 5'-phosphate oxidase